MAKALTRQPVNPSLSQRQRTLILAHNAGPPSQGTLFLLTEMAVREVGASVAVPTAEKKK